MNARKTRLHAAYKTAHGSDHAQGAVAWFLSELLSNHSRSAVYRWFSGENIMDGHVLEVALHTLEGTAVRIRLDRIEAEARDIREGLR